jgi:hypothetical protein
MAALSAVGIAISRPALAEAVGNAVKASAAGPLKSAGVLTFGRDNVLFVGDIVGAAVHAFKLNAQDLTSQTDVVLGNFDNF